MDDALPEIGVDWLTMTLPRGASSYGSWCRQAARAVQYLEDDGNERKDMRLLGFDGFLCGSVFYGENEARSLLRISSAWADRLFTMTYHPEAHYSRLDLQVTWSFSEERQGHATGIYSDLVLRNEGKEGKQRLKARLVTDNDGGSTCYVGSRQSTAFGRIYNKGAQSDEERYRNAWRYEVEYHNALATAAAGVLWSHYEQSRQWIASNVAGWFDKRGILAPWQRAAWLGALPPSQRPSTDVSTKLAWLERQVRPTVLFLLENVPRRAILEALGLSSSEQTPPEGVKEDL